LTGVDRRKQNRGRYRKNSKRDYENASKLKGIRRNAAVRGDGREFQNRKMEERLLVPLWRQ